MDLCFLAVAVRKLVADAIVLYTSWRYGTTVQVYSPINSVTLLYLP